MKGDEFATGLAAAESYDAAIVTGLTGEWAPRLVRAAAVRPGHRVLDVACGTGVLSRAAAEATGPTGAVTGLDMDPGMLAVASRRVPGVAWHRGSAGALPFPDATFDAVVSQFGLMFFGDRPRALREMWRVLRPGGRLAVAVWASLEETPAYDAEVKLVERLAGAPAADLLRSPFVLGVRDEFAGLFRAAGIPLTSLTTEPGTGAFPSIRAMLEADLIGWLPLVGIRLDRETIERILAEGESVFAPYRTPAGTVRFASPAHIAVAARTA